MENFINMSFKELAFKAWSATIIFTLFVVGIAA